MVKQRKRFELKGEQLLLVVKNKLKMLQELDIFQTLLGHCIDHIFVGRIVMEELSNHHIFDFGH